MDNVDVQFQGRGQSNHYLKIGLHPCLILDVELLALGETGLFSS